MSSALWWLRFQPIQIETLDLRPGWLDWRERGARCEGVGFPRQVHDHLLGRRKTMEANLRHCIMTGIVQEAGEGIRPLRRLPTDLQLHLAHTVHRCLGVEQSSPYHVIFRGLGSFDFDVGRVKLHTAFLDGCQPGLCCCFPLLAQDRSDFCSAPCEAQRDVTLGVLRALLEFNFATAAVESQPHERKAFWESVQTAPAAAWNPHDSEALGLWRLLTKGAQRHASIYSPKTINPEPSQNALLVYRPSRLSL